ncbi:flagellar biosynthesis protein FlhB [Geobacter sp. SVR]|uniref:flagellar biosynthesis protein FlhB n=1 Tax=Geobacter sp. SVR TaxID=2495594 RepID=UPI00143EF827|nr:flagellar biosynthesis protein FlhB [Geobacter sp. SVR]BCS55811.1 flagellar biosynthesis protein FlhB [Geobacter sp. SVR]GCF83815.1 flagellar biosynthesis protein FlhB [Geobacter sp. SVR]
MADDVDKHSKTEQPTSKRLEKAREEGTPPTSILMTSTFTLLTGMICLYLFGNFMFASISEKSVEILSSISSFQMTEQNLYNLVLRLFLLIVMVLAPLIVTILLTSITSHAVQDGGRLEVRWTRVGFKIDKLNPLTGFGRLFNKNALLEVVKSFLKLAVIGFIAYRVLRDEVQNITFMAEADIASIADYMGHVAFKIVIHTCGIMLIIAVLDLMYVKWDYIQKLKMTKQEVKDEQKDYENPEIKGRIKKMQFQMAHRRMTKIIPTADVVITNPTHYAIALKYDRARMIAPVVIAKGVDVMAQAIKKIAQEHKITLVENRFLARELYDQVDENEAIPESLYAAVAEILAYVYRIKGKV